MESCLQIEEKVEDVKFYPVRVKTSDLRTKEKVIGIVGGMGPVASLDLVQKILNETDASSDQDHLPIVFISVPHRITDRTAFLLGETEINPAISIAHIILELHKLGANIIGIPCNTSFAPAIYDEVIRNLKENNIDVKIVHIIEEVALYIERNYQTITNVGILCTKGLYRANGYAHCFAERRFNIILPDEDINHNFIHKAIYDPIYGIKAKFNPITAKAKDLLNTAISHLIEKNAEVVVLGCTELSLAIKDDYINGTFIIDPTTILARSLIREVDESKLKIS